MKKKSQLFNEQDRVFYIDEVITRGEQQYLALEEITKAVSESISRRRVIENSQDEYVLVEFDSDFDPASYLDTFIAISTNDELNIEVIKNSKKAGNHPLVYKIRNSLMGIRRYIQNNSTLPVLQEEVVPNQRWFIGCLNVGDGDSTVIFTPSGRTYVIDFGNKNQNCYQKIVAFWDHLEPMLNQPIERSISGLVITHPDRDHYSGFIDVVDNLTLSRDCFIFFNSYVTSASPLWGKTLVRINQLIQRNILRPIQLPTRNNKPTFQNLFHSLNIGFLWPHQGLNFTKNGRNQISKNDSSLSFIMTEQNDIKFNIVGDIENTGWNFCMNELQTTYLNLIPIHYIYKYSHHGRNSGSPLIVRGYFDFHSINRVASCAGISRHTSPSVLQNDLTNVGHGKAFEIQGRLITLRTI